MVEVTQADRQLSALIIKCSEVEHGAKLIASHREAAAKAERDRIVAWLSDYDPHLAEAIDALENQP